MIFYHKNQTENQTVMVFLAGMAVEKASYAYQKAFNTGKINAFLVGSPGSFTVTTLTTPQNMAVGEIEVLFEPEKKYCYVSLAFHTEIGAKYQAYQGMAQIGKDF